jgi:adenylate cyclase
MLPHRPKVVLLLICLGSALLWILLHFISIEVGYYRNQPNALIRAELSIVDQRIRNGRKAPYSADLVFVGIDRSNYSEDIFPEDAEAHQELSWISREWPFPRQVYAFLLERFFESGARVVAIDLLMPNEGTGDDALADVLRKYQDRVVLGANLMDRTETVGSTIRTHNEFRLPNPTLLDAIGSPVENSVAFVNFFPDAHSGNDGTVRTAVFQRQRVNASYYSFSALTAIKAGIQNPRLEKGGHHFFRFTGPPNTYPFISLLNFLDPVLWEANLKGKDILRDKIVLLGPYGNWSQDFHNTPYPTMLGPEVHLQALGAILSDSFYSNLAIPPPPRVISFSWGEIMLPEQWSPLFTTWVIILLLALVPFPIFQISVNPILRALALLLAGVLWVLTTLLIYNRMDAMIPAFVPLLALGSSGTGGLIYQFVRDQMERAKTRAYFEKYVSSNVVAEILNRPDEFENSLEGKRLPCTILFSDIRGFTSMTESGDSQQLVFQLNEYLTEMVECVFDQLGTLDKFIGDAVMAVWGNAASQSPRDDARKAVLASMEMIDALQRLNHQWKKEGRPLFEIGIGLNHGDVIAGDMGSPRRKDFTVIGDAVNLASRLEGLTKQYHVPIILGESVADLVRDDFVLQTVDRVRVKGKTQPVTIFTTSRKLNESTPRLQEGLEAYEQAIEHFTHRRFSEALRNLELAQTALPRDPLVELYLSRSREYLDTPPPDDWDGVVTITTK